MTDPRPSSATPIPTPIATPISDPDALTVLGPPCRALRSKKMFIYEHTRDECGGEEDSSIYWCIRNQMKNFGPDDEHVNGRSCRDTGRSCYES